MKPSEYLATLERGRQYRLHVLSGAQEKFIVFNHGTAIRVSEDLKIQLKEHAVFPVQTKFSTGEAKESYECQFTFDPAD